MGLEHIDGDGRFRDVAEARAAHIRSNKFAFSRQHVLYGKLRPNLAKIAAPDFDGICSTDILPLRPHEGVERRYLMHFLRTPAMVNHAAARAVGVNLPRLSPQTLNSFLIPLPPVEEQRRIAEILDSAQTLRVNRFESIDKLDEFVDASFATMFESEESASLSDTTTLGMIADIVSGATPKTSVERYWDGDVVWATPKDLSELDGPYIDATSRSLSRAGLESCSATLLPSNSVLLSSRAPIGYVAINTVPMATNQGFKSLVLDPSHTDPRFLYVWLRRHRARIESLGSGATFKEISKRVVARIEIRLPALSEQRRFGEIFDAVEKTRIGYAASRDMLNTLFASLQQRAFRGEL